MKRGVIILVSVVAVIGVVFVILLLFSHRSTTTAPKTMSVWIPFDEASAFETMSADYKKANPGIQLDIKYIQATSLASYEAQVVNAIANGSGPDVWLVRNDWIPKHIDKSAAAFAADGSDPIPVFKKQIIGNLVDANVVDGKLYGVPVSADALFVIYNVDYYNANANFATTQQQATALKNVATTWDDLKLQVSAVSKGANNTIVRSGLALGTSDNTLNPVDVVNAMLVQQNGAIVSNTDHKTVTFNLANPGSTNPIFPATNALDYFTSFAKSGSDNYSWNSSQGDPVQAFLSQKTGALIGYYTTAQQILAANPKFDVQLAALPQQNSTVNPRVDFGYTWSFVVNKNSVSPGSAWTYLSYLATRDNLNTYADQVNKLSPALTSNNLILQSGLQSLKQAPNLVKSEFPTMASLYKPEWQQTDQIIKDTIDLVTVSGQAPQTSVDTAAQRFKALVGQ